MEGTTFAVLFVPEDTTKYCKGKFTRRGKGAKGTASFDKAMERFLDGTVWLLTKAALVSKEKPLYIGSSANFVIDLNSSTFSPVLQSTAFTNLVPTPAEALATLSEAADH